MREQAWTRERIDLLRKLWAAGETAGAIGVRLGGMSRSAVLGKIFRLRLGDPDPAAPSKKATAARRIKEKTTSPARRRRSKRDSVRLSPLPPARRGKTLLELKNDSCRWPFGRPGTDKFHFCGALGADLARGLPYCARHMQRAYPTSTSVGDNTRPAAGALPASVASTADRAATRPRLG